ncbi:hypothetical protein BJX65DRAFT_311977 [Aspergillus insuetus]
MHAFIAPTTVLPTLSLTLISAAALLSPLAKRDHCDMLTFFSESETRALYESLHSSSSDLAFITCHNWNCDSAGIFIWNRVKNMSLAAAVLLRDVALTCNVMRQRGESLGEDNDARLCSAEAFQTAREVLAECQGVFKTVDDAITPFGEATMFHWLRHRVSQRAAKARRDPQLVVLGSSLERLKSTMLLMLNVIMDAAKAPRKKEARALREQRQLINTPLKEKAANENRYRVLSKAIEPVDELQRYYSLMKTLLREIDAVQVSLQQARYGRI